MQKVFLRIDRQVRMIKWNLNHSIQPVFPFPLVNRNTEILIMSISEFVLEVSLVPTGSETEPVVNTVPNDYEESVAPQISHSDFS